MCRLASLAVLDEQGEAAPPRSFGMTDITIHHEGEQLQPVPTQHACASSHEQGWAGRGGEGS